MPPVIKDQPFNIFWAAPTLFCKDHFGVNMNLQVFDIIANPLETQSGSTIAILYPNKLGYYPYFSEDGKPFYGGIPQNGNLSEHLKKSSSDIADAATWWRSEGLAVIDWEGWKPQWDRNWGSRVIYRNHSLAFTRHHHPDWSEVKVRTVAQQEFENAGRSFMNVTLTLASEMRPKRLWGFYLYPDCYNYDYRINPEFYTGSCPDDEIFRNDQLLWLWEKSTALYPSIYLSKILKSNLNALKFVHFRSIEALSEEDLVHTIGESAALGAAGIILWGGYEYSDSKMIGSPRLKDREQNVTIFYANKLGYYPWYTSEGVPINGGLPQNTSLQVHLEKAAQDINYYIPGKNFSGLSVIDWEYWRPQWARNWDSKNIYRQNSRRLISEMKENTTADDIEYLAKATFEKSAKAFMEETIKLGIRKRPKGLWGYYLYPDCHNYNFHDTNYTGSCPVEEVLRNDELSWLWNSSTALYPAIYIKKVLRNSEHTLHFSQFRVHESMRISNMTSHDYALPLFIYTQLGYRDEPLLFLSKQDLISTIGESAALGAAGIVIWGDMNLTSSKENCTKVNRFVNSDFGTYIINVTRAAELYRAPVLKTACYWHKNRHVDQWNRIEDPDINPHRYENLIFDKDAKTVKWKKESIFNKWCWHNWMATCRRLQIDPYLSPCTKLKSKWIKDLNINPVTLNLIEEKVGSTLERIGTGDHFLNITPTAQTLSATINQWDYMKLRSFCKAKDTITKTKCQPTEWEKIFTNLTSDRGLISRIYKELKKHDVKTSNSPIEKWAIELNILWFSL
ncbi:hypothetical protein STEG23_019240 [Scotinomys teguina]